MYYSTPAREANQIELSSRDGRGLSVNDITSGIVNATNIDPDFILGFTQSRFTAIGASLNGTIDLEDLNVHDVTEHDASLTRLDAIQGQTLTVQRSLVSELISDITAIGSEISGGVTTSSLGYARARREKESQAAGSPPLPDGFESLALGEAGLVLLLLGQGDITNPDTMWAPSWQVHEWFMLERFPNDWTMSPTVLTVADDLDPIVGRIAYWQQQWAPQV